MLNKSISDSKAKWEKHNLKLCRYASGDKPASYEVQCLNLVEYPNLKQVLEAFYPLHKCDEFANDRNFMGNLRFYCIVVESLDQLPIFFFRLSTRSSLAKPGKKFIGITDSGSLTLADPPLFSFDEKVDCICQGDDLFIFGDHSHQFHQMFRFYEEAVKRAQENAVELTKWVPIANFDSFRESCDDFNAANKLNGIVANKHLEGIHIDTLERFIIEEDLGITVSVTGGVKRLVFEKSLKWAFLDLLGDANVESKLTKRKYRASSMRPRKASAGSVPSSPQTTTQNSVARNTVSKLKPKVTTPANRR